MVWIVLIIIAAIWLAGRWLLFKEQKIDAWKSCIPFYSDYLMYKIAGIPVYFYISFPAFILVVLLFGNVYPTIMDSLCLIIAEAIVFVSLVIRSYYLGKAIKQNIVISFLIFFFEPIVLLVLGLKKPKAKTEEK